MQITSIVLKGQYSIDFTIFHDEPNYFSRHPDPFPVKGNNYQRLLTCYDHPTVRVIAKLLPEFEAETGIDVNIEVIPFEAMTRKARQTLDEQSARYDVFMDGWGLDDSYNEIELGGAVIVHVGFL